MNQILIFLQALIPSMEQKQGIQRDQGQGLAEYALILLFVAIAVIAAITAVGIMLDTAYYDRLASELFSG